MRTANATLDGGATQVRDAGKRSTSASPPIDLRPTISVPGLPELRPYALLQGVWKPAHTNAVLAAQGEVDPLVERTARNIDKQQVGFDGLISRGGAGVLDLGASAQALPRALYIFNVLFAQARECGGDVTAEDGTVLILQGGNVRIRLRESLERRENPGKDTIRSFVHVPAGRLSFSVISEVGGHCRTAVADRH